MSLPELSLTRTDVAAYCSRNSYATLTANKAADDYVAARCTVLTGLLHPGFHLAAQAIEKMLKVCIYLETGIKMRGHELAALTTQLTAHGYALLPFNAIIGQLQGLYFARYADESRARETCGTQDLEAVDELWATLFDLNPMPDEVKYRLAFTTQLFEAQTRYWWPQYSAWTTDRNKSLVSRLPSWKRRYKEVRKHLYPTLPEDEY